MTHATGRTTAAHGLRLAALAAVLLGTASTASAQDAASLADPVTLFNTVCLGDKVSLPAKSFEETPFARLPGGARIALAFAFPDSGPPAETKPPKGPEVDAIFMPQPLPPTEMTNRVLAVLPKKQAFLILPAANAAGRYAPFCTVLWRGDHYADALKIARGLVPTDPSVPLGKAVSGFNYTALQGNGAIVAAAEYQGWTVLRAAPDQTPSEKQPAQ